MQKVHFFDYYIMIFYFCHYFRTKKDRRGGPQSEDKAVFFALPSPLEKVSRSDGRGYKMIFAFKKAPFVTTYRCATFP